MPSRETCETYASILLKARKVEFKPGIWHMQPPGELCEAAAEALRQHHALVDALEHVTELLVDTWADAMDGDPEKEIAVADARTLLRSNVTPDHRR